MPDPADERQPWSPFPVQDWSTLPVDPLAPTPQDWPPPQPPRPWWRPLIVLALVASLVTAATLVARSVGTGPPDTVAREFLPSDGAVTWQRTEAVQRERTDITLAVTESAVLSGASGALSTDFAFGAKLLPELGNDIARVRLLRTTSTPVNDPAGSEQTVRVYRTDSAITLLGESGPAEAHVFRPALVELPADVRAGMTWTSAGSAGDALDYQASFRSEEAGERCLRVIGTIRYLAKSGQPGPSGSRTRTWCRGEGMVLADDASGSTTSTTGPAARPDLSPPGTVDSVIEWRQPELWAARGYDTISIDPTYGDGPMAGTPQTAAVARAESGLVYRIVGGSNDLVALTPKTTSAWVAVWRGHPGGAVLTVRAFGHLVLVTTSERLLVAYSDQGVRLWQVQLDEIAPTPPVRVDAATAAIVDLAGQVRTVELATGVVGWQYAAGADVRVAPAVGAGLVVVGDRGGTVTALDATTGGPRWTADLEASGLAVVGDTISVAQDQTLHGLDAGTGEHLWLRPFSGVVAVTQAYASGTLLGTSDETLLVGMDGAVRQRFGAALEVTTTGSHAVLWGTTTATVLNDSAAVIAEWQLPPLTPALQQRPGLALGDGVMLMSNDWSFRVWNDGV